MLFTTLGCRTAPVEQPQSARLAFSADRRPAVFEAAVETLREYGYRIDRQDYRFGTITTFPKEAATAAEFWINDATTPAQRTADTLNSQQRAVTVQIQRPKGEPGFVLTVEVLVQRLQRPDRYLTHSASPRITRAYTDTPMHLKDQGIDGPYAQRLHRDPLLERRLIESIKAAVKANPSEETGLRPRLPQEGCKVELAQSLLESLSQDPLTKKQRADNPELVTLDRFQRGQLFVELFDLLDSLKKQHPDDELIAELHERAVVALGAFEGLTPVN